MIYNQRRPFGKYTELLLVARQAYEQRNNVELVWDMTVDQLKPIVSTGDTAMFGHVKVIQLHPCDYIWVLLGHNPTWAHKVSLEWQLWNIERMTNLALARINLPTPTELREGAMHDLNVLKYRAETAFGALAIKGV